MSIYAENIWNDSLAEFRITIHLTNSMKEFKSKEFNILPVSLKISAFRETKQMAMKSE